MSRPIPAPKRVARPNPAPQPWHWTVYFAIAALAVVMVAGT